MELRKIRVFKGTWCGRKGTSTDYRFTTKALGKRVIVHVWDDTPNVAELHAMTGSFWRGPIGRTFEKLELVDYTLAEIQLEVHRLAEKHFNG